MKNHFLRVLFFPIILALGLLITGCASTTPSGTSKDAILAWSNEAVLAAFTYDYAHYPQQFRKASHYFTTEGWKNYAAALKASGNLKTVTSKKMLVSAVAQGSPQILSKAATKGQDAWKVEIPVLLSYQNAHTNLKQSVIITLVILRTNGQKGVRGLALDQFIVQPAIKGKK